MQQIFGYISFFFCFISYMHLEATEKLFFPLSAATSSLIGKEITITGFLTPQESGEWLISSQPKIPSCCQEKKERKAWQILTRSLPIKEWPCYQIITIKGILGEEKDLFFIEQPMVMQ